MKTEDRILFLLKQGNDYEGNEPYSYSHYISSGLYWSAKFVTDMLQDSGVDAKLVLVEDNNSIDAEVAKFSPSIVIIEALWVVPEKFDILKELHPDVQFIVRIHSDAPFLANEGIAISWIKKYAARGVRIAANSKKSFNDLTMILDSSGLPDQVVYLPDYYPMAKKTCRDHEDECLKVACYGAIRPLKNQLIQAVAAIKFADSIGKEMRFHINGTRVEMGGKDVLMNMRALFAGTDHTLVEDEWFPHEKFLEKLEDFDLGMQVSFSETFSIVAADMVSVGIPIVVSPEVRWATFASKVDPTDSESIAQGLKLAYMAQDANTEGNREKLRGFGERSKKTWLDFLEDERSGEWSS